MNKPLSPSDADWAAQVAEERSVRHQSETALAVAQAEIAALKQELAATASHGQRHLAQLTALVQTLRAGLLLVDDEGQIQFVNHYFWELFGLPPVAGPAEGAPPIAHSAVHIGAAFMDPAAFATRARALHAAGQTVLNEVFMLADGRVVELDYLVLDSLRAGRLICYRDVTERHQREAQVRALSYISQQNPNPILRLTLAGEVVYANPAAEPLLAALRAEPAAAGWPPALRALVHAALHGQQLPHPEFAVAGQHYVSTAVALPDQAYATLYLTNITARQQTEQLLAEQQAFYESVLEEVPCAVSVLDAEHRYLFLNPVIEPDPIVRAWMIGKTNQEACAYRLRPEAVMRNRATAFAEVLREQREVSWEETRLDANGQPQHILLRYRPMRGPSGVVRVICSGIDITERKQAEEKIVRQQEFYESILNLLPVDVAVFDAEHRFLFVNPSSVSDPAVRKQIIGMTSAEYFAFRHKRHPAATAAQREQYFDLAVRTRADVTWEEMRTGPNQRPQLMLRHLRPVFDATGNLQLVVGSGIDITARYTAEKLQHEVQRMLKTQQTFIRQILDALPNVLYMVDPDNSVSFSNHAYEMMMAKSGYRQNMGPAPQIHEQLQEVQRLNQLVRTTRQTQTQELLFTLATGETRYYQVHKRPLRRTDGQLGILTISTDVTDVKLARHELERREKQYHDLVYYSQALICTHDLQGKVLTVNPAIERLMGAPASQLVGHFLHEALPPEHHASLQTYLAGSKHQHQQPGIMTVWTFSGERRYLQYYAYQVSEDGHAPYVVASGYDVTTGVLAQRALQHAKQDAEENAQAKEAFLARMSHEIRTPLNGVLGMAGLLQKTPLTEPQREYLNTMQHAGRHLLSLLNDVLDMAKITTQHLQLDHAPFDLAVALHGAGQTVAALAEQKGLRLIVEPLATAAPRVVGDAYRLHQVLLNLLSNAIKFTERGYVRLGTNVIHDTPDQLTLRFWVEDTGIGIAAEQQGHIFEAFAQASAETSRQFGGTGLGLSISQQLVSQMGGMLLLCTEPNEGTTFSFTLALPRPREATAEQSREAPPASYDGLRGLRVLLAEDNLVNQWIAVVVLENWGVRVQAVSNGLDALAHLREGAFDAAILDIKMPGLSGVEVTTAIRANPDATRANLPIIALTANAFEADRIAYLAAGMNACVTKPYEEADLGQILLQLTADRPAAE
ncbi:PAS domain-containing protein [Hymenobacter sp. BT683]|uniref:histidine kinase n=1 Tax=Hymenobacter jeongseonensis TaxID=2791027 RepID=A0ABS0IGT6_9BACT|nr:PAS domain-containing protein [Hymenobacter jeongseonensis]MBF9237143.1 PAS domain-containing protein [Hymenobacter jeongseonensis]